MVRFRLDALLRAGGAPGAEVAGRPLPRRLRPASRLVPLVAARIRGNARTRALRCGAHARLHPGGAGPREDVEVEGRSEEHTSELQSLMRISYAVFCLKKKNTLRNIPLSQSTNPE